MRAKTIYETINFERGLDPKEAMTIGIEGKFKTWLKQTYGVSFNKIELSSALHYAVMADKLEFVKWLIDEKKAPVTNAIIGVAFANHVDDEIKMYLITNGDKKRIEYLTDMKYLRDMKKVPLDENYSAAKFVRGMDPKDAMNLGDKVPRQMKKLLDTLTDNYGGQSQFYMKRNRVFKGEENVYTGKYYYPFYKRDGYVDEHVFIFDNDKDMYDYGTPGEYQVMHSFPEHNVLKMNVCKDIEDVEKHIIKWIDELNDRWS